MRRRVDASWINNVKVAVVLKFRPTIRGIKYVDRGIVDAGLTEVARNLLRRGHRVNHGIGHGMPEAFVVHEEERPVVHNRTAQGGAEIVLHHVIVSHVIERRSVHESVSQEFVNRSVILIAAAASHNVDLAAACAAHLG